MDRQLFFQSQPWLHQAPPVTMAHGGVHVLQKRMQGTSSSSSPLHGWAQANLQGGADSALQSITQPRKRMRAEDGTEPHVCQPRCSCAWVALHASCHVSFSEQGQAKRCGSQHSGQSYRGVLTHDVLHIAFSTSHTRVAGCALPAISLGGQTHPPAQDPMQCNAVLRLHAPQVAAPHNSLNTSPAPAAETAAAARGEREHLCAAASGRATGQAQFATAGDAVVGASAQLLPQPNTAICVPHPAEPLSLEIAGQLAPSNCELHHAAELSAPHASQDILLDGVSYTLQANQVKRVVMSEAVAAAIAQLAAGKGPASTPTASRPSTPASSAGQVAGGVQAEVQTVAAHPLVAIVPAVEQGPRPPFITLTFPHVCLNLYKRVGPEGGEAAAAEALWDLAR